MIVPYSHILALSGLLFLMGMGCVLARRNLIMMVLGLEIMLNAAAVAFVGASLRWQQMEGQTLVIFILAVAAAEVSIGLALIVYAYRRTGSVDPNWPATASVHRRPVPDDPAAAGRTGRKTTSV